MKNIFTVFAGRKRTLSILLKYLQIAIKDKVIDEVHLWNYTRENDDDLYIQEVSNLMQTSSTREQYIEVTPLIINKSFTLVIKGDSEICVKISDEDNNIYEMIGEAGSGNDDNVIRIEICPNDKLHIHQRGRDLIVSDVVPGFNIEHIFVKTFLGSKCLLKYETVKNNGIYYFDTCQKKPWHNYYSHYVNPIYENDVVIKCDDDIVFLDLKTLPNFISYVRDGTADIVFANTINNGVSAFYQQNKFHLLPDELGHFEYPEQGLYGSLWSSGEKASLLHKYFIANHEKFLTFDYHKEVIPIDTRFSINLFAMKAEKWHKISDCGEDDEYNLTVNYVLNRGLINCIYSEFYASHLSFYKQNENFPDIEDVINQYKNLFTKLNTMSRFIVINSHINSAIALNHLLHSLKEKEEFTSHKFIIAIGGYYELEQPDIVDEGNIKYIKCNHNSIDFTGLITIMEMYESDVDNMYLYLHDTCKVGNQFFSKLKSIEQMTIISSMKIKHSRSMNIGIYSQKLINSFKPFLLSMKNMSKEREIEFKTRWNSEDHIFNNDPYNFVLNNYNEHQFTGPMDYYGTGTQRIVEYYPNLDLYKIKANYGQIGNPIMSN